MTQMTLTRLLLHGAVWYATACSAGHPSLDIRPERPVWKDARGFENRLVGVRGTVVHTIDYGGSGPPLVFLAGLGNSAHVFDDFAPRFIDRFHVYGVTRRGYGESGKPNDGFHTMQLVDDVRAALDSLGVERATLVAHSVGGDEITGFAARFPARVDGLVYLEAAYDRHGMTGRLIQRFLLNQLPPTAPRPGRRDKSSVTAFGQYLESIYGVAWPESEVRATRRFDASGKYLGDAAASSTGFKVMRGEEALPYARVTAPVLAIYASDRSIDRDYPWIKKMSIGRGFKQLDAWRASGAQDRFERGERKRLREALPNARIVELRDASHYVFISHAERVEREMRRFLLSP